MKDFQPYFTNDGSVGLYNPEFDDIYHSSTGALTEAYEKFVYPINFETLLNKDSINILDICYGVGYNSKSFLNFIFKNFYKKNIKNHFKNINNYAPIYTDKKASRKNGSYNEEIYTDNILSKINITAIDNDKNLVLISPFIKTGKNNFKNKNFDLNKKNIGKYLKKENKIKTQKIDNLINFLIFEKIAQKFNDFYTNRAVTQAIFDKKYADFFEPIIRGIYRDEILNRYSDTNYNISGALMGFLHNIYYQYVSYSYKKRLKYYNLDNINFDVKISDARVAIKNDTNTYNLIFLDAFTPSKCPCLWSYEFFKELNNKLVDDGMLLTYSSSAAVRAAMVEAGFYIGNLYNEREDKFTGTIAVKDISLIEYPLSDFDLGLLKTSAGIFYRDEDLNGLNEAISEARKLEVKESNRLSTSQYKKNYNKGDKCNNMT